MMEYSGVKIAPAINVNVPQKKKAGQKAIAQMYYDMYAIADSLAVEDIRIRARQIVHERMDDEIEKKEKLRELSFVEIYKMRIERTEFHLNNMITMFNKACEQSGRETGGKPSGCHV